MKIQLLIDNRNSWMVPYAIELTNRLLPLGHSSVVLHQHDEVERGEVLVMLSCEKIFKKLELNKHNLVVHESALPKGKGWSPVTWQVLEGKKIIPVTLFEATTAIDSGVIYGQKNIELEGHELINEIRSKQAYCTIELILEFIELYPNVMGVAQIGEASFYPKRLPSDSELSVNKSIEEQFNLLRICDNERYPAYFIKEGKKYFVRIEKEKN